VSNAQIWFVLIVAPLLISYMMGAVVRMAEIRHGARPVKFTPAPGDPSREPWSMK
jgi:hypothetical protein